MLIFMHGVIIWDVSQCDVIKIKKFHEILRYFFQILTTTFF